METISIRPRDEEVLSNGLEKLFSSQKCPVEMTMELSFGKGWPLLHGIRTFFREKRILG